MTRPDFPRFAFPTAALHCGGGVPLLIMLPSSGECRLFVVEYALVGPNSEDIARVRPFPIEFCLVRGDMAPKFLDSLPVEWGIANESPLL